MLTPDGTKWHLVFIRYYALSPEEIYVNISFWHNIVFYTCIYWRCQSLFSYPAQCQCCYRAWLVRYTCPPKCFWMCHLIRCIFCPVVHPNCTLSIWHIMQKAMGNMHNNGEDPVKNQLFVFILITGWVCSKKLYTSWNV